MDGLHRKKLGFGGGRKSGFTEYFDSVPNSFAGGNLFSSVWECWKPTISPQIEFRIGSEEMGVHKGKMSTPPF